MPNSRRQLSHKQKRFCTEYVATMGNGAAAARNAGYSESSAAVTAHRLLLRNDIQKQIGEVQRALFANADQRIPARILDGILAIAFADPESFRVLSPMGIRYKTLEELSDNEKLAVRKITPHSIELHDKIKALELLGDLALKAS